MSNAEQSPVVESSAKSGGGGRTTILILALALILVSAVCGYALYTLRGAHAGAAAQAAPAKEKQPELYLALDPAFVVNFRNNDSLSYLQVGITLMSHDPLVIQSAKEADPVIRNALLMLLSSQDITELTDTVGKQKLQAKALAAVQKIITERTGKPGVDALYFTSFVMQ